MGPSALAPASARPFTSTQVIKSKTAAGFVPNFAGGGAKSMDRTEPPVGAKALLQLFGKYHDAWIVELLFDDLLDCTPPPSAGRKAAWRSAVAAAASAFGSSVQGRTGSCGGESCRRST